MTALLIGFHPTGDRLIEATAAILCKCDIVALQHLYCTATKLFSTPFARVSLYLKLAISGEHNLDEDVQRNRGQTLVTAVWGRQNVAKSPAEWCRGPSMVDLLFSARAAFVWDKERAAVTWMNGAARNLLNCDAAAFTAALSRAARVKLSSFACGSSKNLHQPATVKIVGKGLSGELWTAAPIELADGHRGVVMTEGKAAPLTASQLYRGPPPSTRNPLPARIAAPGTLCGPAGPRLSERELASFKAIGRKVRSLCKAKLEADGPAAIVSQRIPSQPLPRKRPAVATHPQNSLIHAFDLVVTIDRLGQIKKAEGRFQRFGWRKTGLIGAPLSSLLAPGEARIVDSMLTRVESGAAQFRREDVLMQTASGRPIACKAFLGRWNETAASFFLAFTATELSPRVQKLRDSVHEAAKFGLAA